MTLAEVQEVLKANHYTLNTGYRDDTSICVSPALVEVVEKLFDSVSNVGCVQLSCNVIVFVD